MSKEEDNRWKTAFVPKEGTSEMPTPEQMQESVAKADFFNNVARALKIETGVETIIVIAVEAGVKKIQYVGITSSEGPEAVIKAFDEAIFGMKESIKQRNGEASQAIPTAELLGPRTVN